MALTARTTIAIKVDHLVKTEMARQRQLWGEQNHNDLLWLPILGEEMGEVNQAVNEIFHQDGRAAGQALLHEEIVHVAAVAMSWLEARERRNA